MQLYQYSPNNFIEKSVLDHMLGKISDLEASENFDTDDLAAVQEDILAKYISFSNTNSKKLLPNLIDILKESSITDKIFDMLLSYQNEEVRTAVIISLSHMKLSVPQLYRLCKEELTFECFYTLGELLYLDDNNTINEFKNFLSFFLGSRFGSHVDDFINSYLRRSNVNEKDFIIRDFLK